MKLSTAISTLTGWFRTDEDERVRKERFITAIVSTRSFSKLSLQDQLISLGKLITLFHADYGYTPKALEKTLILLNYQLARNILATWAKVYPTGNLKLHNGKSSRMDK